MRTRWFLAVALALLVPAVPEARSADDAAPPAAATVVVDLASEPGTGPWLADAFEQSIVRELSGFERLTTVAKEDFAARDCGADRRCRLRVYQQSHIDIVFFGGVTDSEIHYELYQTWTPARLATGTIAIGRTQSAIGLKHETRDAFHPVLKHGGLLDQRPHTYAGRTRTSPGATGTPSSPGGTAVGPDRAVDPGATGTALWAAVALLVLVLVLPFGVLVARGSSVRRVAGLRSARWTAMLLAGLAIAGTVVHSLALGSFDDLVAGSPWVLAGAGGLAWGALAITTARRILPPLDGLARVAPYDVRRIIRTWCLVVVQRLVGLAVVVAVLVALSARISGALAIPGPWRALLILPATWWLARLWLASWVECLAIVLDDRLVDGAASPANPWPREIADYLLGYVRRTGWDVDRELLSRIVLLPGRNVDGIATYGGGATHARIVIDQALLELAMGPLDEPEPDADPDDRPDDQPAQWPDWTAAMVMPGAGDQPRRTASAVAYHGRRMPRAASRVVVRKPLGQAATLLGYVVAAPGELVPLISDNPQDLAVVRELLSEHYPWNAPDPDDEFDPTDPTDKDLLFGALVRELGVIQRGDCRWQTIKLALGRRVARLGSGGHARLADAYAALNFARDHLVQYLYYRWSGATDLLTARARPEQLHATATRIVERLREPPVASPPGPRAIRRRLTWLSSFFAAPIVDRRDRWVRRLVAAGAIAAALAGAGILVQRAIDYHAIYAARIEAQQRAASERNDQRKQKEVMPHGEAQKN